MSVAQKLKYVCSFCGKRMRSKNERTKHAKDCTK